MRWAWLGLLLVAVTSTTVQAKPKRARTASSKASKSPRLRQVAVQAAAAPTSFFLAANPHVPLAIVREGAVRDAVAASERGKTCGSKRRWGAEGSTWNALDAWGQFKGVATLDLVESFEVTACDEVYFAPKFDRNTNAMLFVSTDSTYVPAPSVEWAVSPTAHWTFQAQLAKLAGPKRKTPYVCSEVPKPTRYFHIGAERLAVGGVDGGLLVASFDGTSWTTEHTHTAACYRPVAVFDLNGDGRPEVVVREVLGEGEIWRDVVLSRDGSGHWSTAAVSPGGGTL